ncbi:unnamed protein product [Chrysodeixis includens]|uniref:Uncharacterized protein n=1 Tax=Chrysodeixis includens TaxID=689277 RepID=A0A9N8L1U0_CHRIL|nr:unnamed protein product [Chrysodeixis includens]
MDELYLTLNNFALRANEEDKPLTSFIINILKIIKKTLPMICVYKPIDQEPGFTLDYEDHFGAHNIKINVMFAFLHECLKNVNHKAALPFTKVKMPASHQCGLEKVNNRLS